MWHRLLLALLLVVVQIGAHAHAIGHLSESHHDQGHHDDPVCEQCLAYGHVGAAAPSAMAPGFDLAPFVPADPAPTISATPPSTPAYQSRAPPR